ncbi:MAG: hypothetical protein ABI885_29560 [Gammaproteobacteria bacterium]
MKPRYNATPPPVRFAAMLFAAVVSSSMLAGVAIGLTGEGSPAPLAVTPLAA